MKKSKQNITKHKSSKQPSKSNKALLYQSQKMEALGTLVTGVAHEINNPVNLIIYNIPLLSKVWQDIMPVIESGVKNKKDLKLGGLTYSFLKENLSQLLFDTEMAANRVSQIVKQLKDFSRQSNVADMEPIEINIAISNAIRLAQTTLKKSNIDLETNLSEDLPTLNGNIQSIEQVVLNLLINAIQAIDHNQGKISIATNHQDKDDRVLISVSDNGRGVNPSISDKLFDPFVTDKQSQGGTGLGLSVSYSLIQAHQGEITYTSKEGEGTTFTVSLPTTPAIDKIKILIADDDTFIQDLLIKAIGRKKWYRIESSYNGIEACIKLGSYHPQLLILDIFMPEMDGLEVCRAIKNDPELSDLKVIITTGYPDHPKLKEVSDLGFDTIFSKPFHIKDLLNKIDSFFAEKENIHSMS